MKLLIITILILCCSFEAIGQTPTYPLNEWIQKLAIKNDYKQEAYREVVTALMKAPGESFYEMLDEMEEFADPDNKRLHIRIQLLRANLIYLKKGWRNYSHEEKMNDVYDILRQALLEAYRIGDEMLIAQLSDYYGRTLYNEEDLAPGVMYCLNAIEIQNKLGVDKFFRAGYLRYVFGMLLFRTREYEKAIFYTQKAFELNLQEMGNFYPINGWNTIGLAYEKSGKADSALIAYGHSMKLAKSDSNLLWTGIISGNIAHILFAQNKFDSAKKLLEYEYLQSVQGKLMDNAANSLRWQAWTNLKLGNKQTALVQIRHAHRIIQQYPQQNQVNYLVNIYQTFAEVYRAFDKIDSSYYYLNLFNHLQDSLDNMVAISKTEIARIKLSNQNSIYKIQSISRQKEADENLRNLIIAGMALVFIILLLLLNRQRISIKHKQQIAIQQKALAETEVKAISEQLDLFTKTLREKTDIIQNLKAKISNKHLNAEQQRIIANLAEQNILTEDDWQNFKRLYEKLYPGFFINMRQKAPAITTAELRFAALTRLQLNSREIASILGISTGSVYKLRQRLRERLHLNTYEDVEKYIAALA